MRLRSSIFRLRRGLAALGLAATLILTASQAMAQQVTLRVGYIPVLGISQLFVMEAEGWAKTAGLDLQLTRFDSGPAMIQALASGKLDVLYAGISPMIVAKANGLGIVVLAATATEEIALVGRGVFADLVTKTGSAAAAVPAFFAQTGRKVKIATQPPGSVPDTVTRYWVREVGKLDASQIEILPMGIDKTQQALLAKAVDVAAIREPLITIVHDLDPEVKTVGLGGEIFPKQPGSVLAVRTAVQTANPAAIDTLVALHVRATALLRTDPKRAAVAVHQFIGAGLTDRATLERALASPSSKFEADLEIIRASVEKMQALQVEIGTLPQIVPLDSLFDTAPYRKAAAP